MSHLPVTELVIFVSDGTTSQSLSKPKSSFFVVIRFINSCTYVLCVLYCMHRSSAVDCLRTVIPKRPETPSVCVILQVIYRYYGRIR